LTDLIAELHAIDLLAGVDDALLARIAAVVQIERLETGQTLMAEGEAGSDMYFVRSGRLVATVRHGAAEVTVARPGPGDVLGESQLIAGGRRTATVAATEPSVLLRLPAAELETLMLTSEALREAVAAVVQRRIHEAALRVALPRAVGGDAGLLDLLCERAAWVQLQRGEVLWEQGAAVDGWYVLVSGELAIVVAQHGESRTVGHVQRGEVFGELAVLSGEPRSATVLAARESWIARFDRQLLEEAVLTRNDALRALLRTTAARLSAQARSGARSARVIAVLQRDAGVDMDGFLRGLGTALGDRGRVVTPEMLHAEGVVGDVRRLPPQHPGWLRFQGWLDARRQEFDYLLLATTDGDTAWTRAALAQSDLALLLADADGDPQCNAVEQQVLFGAGNARVPPVWLVLEHPAERTLPHGTASWLDARAVAHHAHLRRGHGRDVARLARWLQGNTVGLALSGGGARGFVHLGTAQALRDAGREFDLIAGTSAGSMAGSLLARDEDPRALAALGMAAIAAQGNPFAEFDLPLISLLRSRRLREGLRQTFGDMQIEDSWIPLRVVATDLTGSRRHVFTRGPVWQTVYASSSPPGVMPPVAYGDSLFCDGGLVDNLPVSVLQEAGCRLKLASYVGSLSSLPIPRNGLPSSWALLFDKMLRRQRYHDAPSLMNTMMQCILVPSSAQLKLAREGADVLFAPDLAAFPATDFTSADAMFEAGKAHALEVLALPADSGPAGGRRRTDV
jgi:NTE family protein